MGATSRFPQQIQGIPQPAPRAPRDGWRCSASCPVPVQRMGQLCQPHREASLWLHGLRYSPLFGAALESMSRTLTRAHCEPISDQEVIDYYVSVLESPAVGYGWDQRMEPWGCVPASDGPES